MLANLIQSKASKTVQKSLPCNRSNFW